MNRRNEKAITLIALVVTIVVLLILVGVSISMLTGENGIITQAKEAKIANEKGKVLDIAELARMNRVIEERNKISDETSLTAIFAELSKEGYEVKTITNAGEELKGIIIQDTTGAEITELNIQQGKETTIKVNLDLQNGTQKHYVLIQGKYYEIAIENGRVVLGENGKEEEALNGQEYTIKLTPPSTGAKLIVGTTEITEETTIVDGAEIKVVAGQNISEYSFNVKVENTTYEENVVLKVVANPLYATGLTLTTIGNETEVEAGSELQIIATIVPETATDEVEWRVISGNATIDNTGLLRVGEDIEANTSIEVGAKCKRSDGTTSTVEEKTITITVKEKAIIRTTIGEAYTEKMIGKTINYLSNEPLPEGTEWIVIGKDEQWYDESYIMLTTSKPIETNKVIEEKNRRYDEFNDIRNGLIVKAKAESWLSYEDDIHEACSMYGSFIRGEDIYSRSMTLEDVNKVTGFVEPEFNRYTFGNTLDFANKQVDFYFPDAGSDNFWSKGELIEETVEFIFRDPVEGFIWCDNNAYRYTLDRERNSVEYEYEGTEWDEENYTTSILKNVDIIFGEEYNYNYFLGSRSVKIYEDLSNRTMAEFNVDAVGGNMDEGFVGKDDTLCQSDSNGFIESDDYIIVQPVRPIVYLPSNIQVEDINGEWNIVYEW